MTRAKVFTKKMTFFTPLHQKCMIISCLIHKPIEVGGVQSISILYEYGYGCHLIMILNTDERGYYC